jgi:thymidylate synthase (FAD)
VDYRLEAVNLSRVETEILSLLNSGQENDAEKMLLEKGFLRKDGAKVKPSLEGRELAEKLRKLGMEIPYGENKKENGK